MAVTFNTLKANAKIFEDLKKSPEWWTRFKSEPDVYIEIRKDNQVNVYYEGGSIARIHYCSKHKKLQVFTHHKYLGHAPSGKNPYEECSDVIGQKLKKDDSFVFEKVLERVKSVYSQKHATASDYPKEKWSEKFIQGSLIVKNKGIHLDSEFAYKDKESDNRIDLIRCDNGLVTFVELKRMDDGRTLHEGDKTPEIVDQMNRYKAFIKKYQDELLKYYQTLYDIKKTMELPIPSSRPTTINPEPVLLIFDRWEKQTKDRDEHRRRVFEILKHENITYKVITEI